MVETHEQSKLMETGNTRFLVILVLYRMCAEASPAFQSLQHVRRLFGLCDVLLWDNSPEWQPVPDGFDGTTVHDPENPGLAVPYNRALQMASDRGIPWLILLDQDTLLTEEYALELKQAAVDAPTNVSMILPRLLHRGRIVSPVRFRPMGPSATYTGEPGLVRDGTSIQAFNSGAAVRVLDMQAVGGFDLQFPLDYLDHATFAALQQAGGSVWILQARLEHSLSSDTGKASTAAQRRRQESVLSARHRFLTLYGPLRHRMFFPLKALREAVSLIVHKADFLGAMQVVRHLFSR